MTYPVSMMRLLKRLKNMIFSEPPVDAVYDELPAGKDDTVLAVEYLPGQYDQRADSAMQCLQMLTMKNDSLVRTAQVLVLSGNLSADDVAAIKHYCINPVEAREASLDPVSTLEMPLGKNRLTFPSSTVLTPWTTLL